MAQALSLPAAAVYTGRAPQKVTRSGLEVWLRPRETEHHGRGGGHQLKVHPYELHLRLRTRREGDQTGATQLEEVAGHLAHLRERYDGTRPFAGALPALVGLQVEQTSVDADPEQEDLLDGTLVLRAVER